MALYLKTLDIFFSLYLSNLIRKKLLIIATIFYAAGTGLFAFANTPITFAILRILAGMGLGGISPVAVTLISDYSPLSQRPKLTTLII